MGREYTRSDFVDPQKQKVDHQTSVNTFEMKRAMAALIELSKTAARKTKKNSGTIKCPRCQKKMKFQYIPETDLYTLDCTDQDCIHIDELEP